MTAAELWLVDLDKAGAALDAVEVATPRLSDECARRFDAINDEHARHNRRRTHIALRVLLERRLGTTIRRQPFVVSDTGKPSLAGREVSFSIAHIPGLALIAIGGGTIPLGVDLERLRKVDLAPARRVTIEDAAIAMAGGAPLLGEAAGSDARFLSAWVRLEAIGKAEGTGVGPILDRLRPGRAADEAGVAATHGVSDLAVHDIQGPGGLIAAVALPAIAQPPPLRRLPDTAEAIVALIGPSTGGANGAL